MDETFIRRNSYLHILHLLRNAPDLIKIITGIRRSGKSCLLKQFISDIANENPKQKIIYLNLVENKNQPYLKAQALYDYVQKLAGNTKDVYLCVDEIQMCDNFEYAVNWLYEEHKYNIYLTGSNAFLLSSDLATLFTGRTYSMEIYPFSLREYMTYFQLTDPQEALSGYIQQGGMAGTYPINENTLRTRYLTEIVNSIIINDTGKKYGIRNGEVIGKLTDYLMDNTGNITSIQNIGTVPSCSNKTIANYLAYLCNAYLFYKIRRYDVAGKHELASQDKYYLCDHTFKYRITGTINENSRKVLENIVAMELLRRDYEVYAGIMYHTEIDFVAVKDKKKLYILISENISNRKTVERECKSLLKIRDQYPKYLLTITKNKIHDYEGIIICDIGSWLYEDGMPHPSLQQIPEQETASAKNTRKSMIIRQIRKTPQITIPEIANAVNLTPKQVRYQIELMKEAGEIRHTGSKQKGKWELREK